MKPCLSSGSRRATNKRRLSEHVQRSAASPARCPGSAPVSTRTVHFPPHLSLTSEPARRQVRPAGRPGRCLLRPSPDLLVAPHQRCTSTTGPRRRLSPCSPGESWLPETATRCAAACAGRHLMRKHDPAPAGRRRGGGRCSGSGAQGAGGRTMGQSAGHHRRRQKRECPSAPNEPSSYATGQLRQRRERPGVLPGGWSWVARDQER